MAFGTMVKRAQAARAQAARDGRHGLSRSGINTYTHARSLAAKLELREHALAFVGANRAHVFDAFSGPGEMHAAVWSRAASYVGCDVAWFLDARRVFVADSRIVLRSIDLAPFTVFDLDSFGSPWEHAAIVCARRRLAPGERIAIVLTEGSSLQAKMSAIPYALAFLSGYPPRAKLANRMLNQAIDSACKRVAERMGGSIEKFWDAVRPGQTDMRYIALGITGREN